MAVPRATREYCQEALEDWLLEHPDGTEDEFVQWFEEQRIDDWARNISTNAQWPDKLTEYLYVMFLAFVADGKEREDALHDASVAIDAMTRHFGGKAMYIPQGDARARILRDAGIAVLFDGRNHQELAELYNVHTDTIYRAIHAVRQRRIRYLDGQKDQCSKAHPARQGDHPGHA